MTHVPQLLSQQAGEGIAIGDRVVASAFTRQ